MARLCDICGKGYLRGNLVPRGIGKRVTRRTLRRQQPNLRTVKMSLFSDSNISCKVCASCLKKMRNEKTSQAEAVK